VSKCSPIVTYKGQGTLKSGLSEAEVRAHAVIYMVGTSSAAHPAEKMVKQPIAVKPAVAEQKLHHMSRVNFDKIYTIEYNVKVMNVGKVVEDSMHNLLLYYGFENQVNLNELKIRHHVRYTALALRLLLTGPKEFLVDDATYMRRHPEAVASVLHVTNKGFDADEDDKHGTPIFPTVKNQSRYDEVEQNTQALQITYGQPGTIDLQSTSMQKAAADQPGHNSEPEIDLEQDSNSNQSISVQRAAADQPGHNSEPEIDLEQDSNSNQSTHLDPSAYLKQGFDFERRSDVQPDLDILPAAGVHVPKDYSSGAVFDADDGQYSIMSVETIGPASTLVESIHYKTAFEELLSLFTNNAKLSAPVCCGNKVFTRGQSI
jgi:hypothetical protein